MRTKRPEIVCGWVSAKDPAGGVYDGPQTLQSAGKGASLCILLPIDAFGGFLLDAFCISISVPPFQSFDPLHT